MTTITIQPAQTIDIDIDNITIDVVRDNFKEQRIIARIPDISCDVVLWDGVDEYTAAGVWTNDSALARAKELLTAGNIRFV
jgi:hypothetical protein